MKLRKSLVKPVTQTEELIADDGESLADMMPRSSPDGSTDIDVDTEQHGSAAHSDISYA